jgi:hypothetical protein
MIKRDNVGDLIAYVTHPDYADELYEYLNKEFDEDAEEYSKKFQDLQGQLKVLKKYLTIKLACLPIEVVLSYALFGKLEAKIRIKMAKKLIKFLKAEHLTEEEMVKAYDNC